MRILERFVVAPVVGAVLLLYILGKSTKDTSSDIEALAKYLEQLVDTTSGRYDYTYREISTGDTRSYTSSIPDIRVASNTGDCQAGFAPYRDRKDYLKHAAHWWQR